MEPGSPSPAIYWHDDLLCAYWIKGVSHVRFKAATAMAVVFATRGKACENRRDGICIVLFSFDETIALVPTPNVYQYPRKQVDPDLRRTPRAFFVRPGRRKSFNSNYFRNVLLRGHS
jgi:hypothetical protein